MRERGTWTWESDRSPSEVIDLLRSASRGTTTAIGGSGLRALILPGRRVVLWRTGGWRPLGRSRFVGRVLARGSGSSIVGTIRTPAVLSILRRVSGARPGATIGRDLEVICSARLVGAPPTEGPAGPR